MNRVQLAERYRVAVNRQWRTMIDNGGRMPPELVDELIGIADEHAQDTDSTTLADASTEATETPTASHRTRTRTRRTD